MRIEERVVTTMQPVYIAEDGKEFKDEEECQEYEFDMLEKSLNQYCFNGAFEESRVEECTFVHMPTINIVKDFVKMRNVIGISSKGVDNPGIYMSSDYNNSWVNLNDITSRFKAVLNGKDGADNER